MIGPCFAMQYLESFLILQTFRWLRKKELVALLYFYLSMWLQLFRISSSRCRELVCGGCISWSFSLAFRLLFWTKYSFYLAFSAITSWLYKCNFLPIYGNVSEFGGIVSETINMKTATDKRTVISMETFSPDSGGKINPSNAIDDINIHGNRRLRT